MFKWPNNASCCVSLTYDDGLDSQVKYALPALKKYGIRGTFFPSGAALTEAAKQDMWRGVAAAGHEIGCHTIHHACDMKHAFVRKGYSLQDYDEGRMRSELELNLKIIRNWGYRAEKPVFAYPCGESAMGEGMSQSYVPLIREMFFAARGIKDEIASPLSVDAHLAPCVEAPQDPAGFAKLVEDAIKAGGWLIVLFHGVGGDYISVTKETHKNCLEYLNERKERVLTAPFGDTADFIRRFNT